MAKRMFGELIGSIRWDCLDHVVVFGERYRPRSHCGCWTAGPDLGEPEISSIRRIQIEGSKVVSLYNAKTANGGYRITKFDDNLEVESRGVVPC
jgi:hypothetical protein